MIPEETFVRIVCEDCRTYSKCSHRYTPSPNGTDIMCHNRNYGKRDAICQTCGKTGRCAAGRTASWQAESIAERVAREDYLCWTPKPGAECEDVNAPIDFTPKYQCRLKGGV